MKTTTTKPISKGLLFLMATAISATVSNLYYNQPLLPSIGESMNLSDDILGFIPSASQIGYATAIFFISPLGDIMNRRLLIRNLSITLFISLIAIYLAPNFWILITATFLMGLSANITQQLLPLGISLSTPKNKGYIVSTLMTGLTAGILISRILSGTIAEYFGWRTVFLVASVLAIIFGFLLNKYLPNNKPTAQLSYPKLLGSMFTLVKKHKLLRESAFIGALWFASFNALWATVAIHVTKEPFFFTVQQAGLLGFAGLSGIVGAKISGKLVDKIGTRPIIAGALLLIVLSFAIMFIWGFSITGLIVGIILLDLGVFGAQIPNQVRIFSIDPKAQSRMNAVYMLLYYLGASVGSALGVKVISDYGWNGLTILGITLPLTALLYFVISPKLKFKKQVKPSLCEGC